MIKYLVHLLLPCSRLRLRRREKPSKKRKEKFLTPKHNSNPPLSCVFHTFSLVCGSSFTDGMFALISAGPPLPSKRPPCSEIPPAAVLPPPPLERLLTILMAVYLLLRRVLGKVLPVS